MSLSLSKIRGRWLGYWRRLVLTRSQDPDQIHQEYMTKVVLVLIESVVFPATILILAAIPTGEIPFYAVAILVVMNVTIITGWWLADHGSWKKVCYLPVVLFFLLGAFNSFKSGLLAVLMGYIIAIVLAAFLLGNRKQWILVGISIIVHFGLGYYHHKMPLGAAIPPMVQVSATFIGIALLQSLALEQLHHALANSRAFADKLQTEITERKRVEQALKLSEEQYRLVVENQGEGVVFVDPQEYFTFANPASEAIFGVSNGDLVGRNLNEFTSHQEFQRIQEQTIKRRTGVKDSYEIEISRLDGERRILLVTATPLFREEQEFTGAFGVLRDITDRKQAEAALSRYAESMEALYETALEIDAQLELPTLLQAIVRRASGLVGTQMAALFLMAPGGNALEMVISDPPGDAHYTLLLGEGLAGQVALCGESKIIQDLAQYGGNGIGSSSSNPVGRALGIPLKPGGKVIGVLTLKDAIAGTFSDEEVKIVSLFADQAALAIDKARLYAEVQRLATVDEVTGLLNRRGLWEFGRREFDRARRFNRPLAAIFLDIDYFKRVNDTYGHAIGDQVLHILSERLKTNTREVDLVAKYGGEEFVILLPEVDTGTALQVAERLRRCTVDAPMVTDQGLVIISISLGVVQIRQDIHDLSMLIDLADQAMFTAKQNGRNRVEVLVEA